MQRGWVVSVIVLGIAGTARGDEPEGPPPIFGRAIDLAREGAQDGDRGKLEEAIRLFKQGYQLRPNPVVFCNIGQVYRLLGELPRAHLMLSECMRRLPAVQPAAVEQFQPVLDEVTALMPEAHVAIDVVTAPAGALITSSVLADDEQVAAPAIVWLPEGVHTITARMPGFAESSQEVTITADDVAGHPRKSVRLELQPGDDTRVEPIVPTEPAPSRASGRRTGGWISLFGGVALLAGGGVMHALAYDTRKELAAGLSGDAYDEKAGTLRTRRTITYALYGAGAAAAITGAVLLYLSPHGDRVRVEPAPAGDGATVWLDLSP